MRDIHPSCEHCAMIIIERSYNQQNKWELRCAVHRTHISWLSDTEANAIWDDVDHVTLSHRKQRY